MNDNRGLNQGSQEPVPRTFTNQQSSIEVPVRTQPLPPSMGTTVRAVKHRVDGDTMGPIRIEGKDIYAQPSQSVTGGNHYQNLRQVLDDSANPSTQSFTAKREFFEERSKPATSNYDAPPRQLPAQKIITTITTTTGPSVDRVLEEAAELQKLANDPNVPKTDSRTPVIIERSEQYQVFLDDSNHEVRRTPSVSRVSIVPVTKTGHATELDHTTSQANRVVDDHQAIHHLTRALQEHNINTVNDYKRLPNQAPPILVNTRTTTTTTTTTAGTMPGAGTNGNEFAVIDALAANPVGTTNVKQNLSLQARLSNIVSSLQNSDYVNFLRQSSKKNKQKKDVATETVERIVDTPLTNRFEPRIGITANPIPSRPVITGQETTNPSQPTKFEVIDAILGSPITPRLPAAYTAKYKSSSPLSPYPSQSSSSNPAYSPAPSSPLSTGRPTYQTSASPRILYRYLDEQGRVLKITPVPPSALRETVPATVPTQPLQKTSITTSTESTTNRDYAVPYSIPVSIGGAKPSRTTSQPARPDSSSSPYPIKLSILPHTYQSDDQLRRRPHPGYDTDSTTSEPTLGFQSYDQGGNVSSTSPREYPFPSPRDIDRAGTPDYAVPGVTRNYIEVFRDGETRPSEIYSLPINTPSVGATHRNSRFDQYQREQSDRSAASPTINLQYDNTLPSSYNANRSPIQTHRDSPANPDDSGHSPASFNYRPLRTKLEREQKITSNLLVDDWEYPSVSTSGPKTTEPRKSLSSPDSVPVGTPTKSRPSSKTEP